MTPFRFVSLAEIDLDDDTFEIRNFSGSSRLEQSLARLGILDPPWLFEKTGTLVVVDGFKRLRFLKENGAEGAVCNILSHSCDAGQLWMRRIEKRIFEREINLVEKARIISVLSELFQPAGIPDFILSELNIAKSPDIIAKWASLWALDRETLELLASGNVAERAAIEAVGWDKKSRDAVFSVLRALKCSSSIQVEIIERINEIARRDGKTGADVVEIPGVRDILESSELNHRQKTQALRDLLSELRNPRLSSRWKRFQREVEALELPPGVRIVPPVVFEGNDWKMEFRFTGPDELRKTFGLTGTVVESRLFDAVFRNR